MSADSVALGVRTPPGLEIRRPALLSGEPIDPETALGRLFAAASLRSPRGIRAAAAVEALGPLAPALSLLPQRERRRADLLAAWTAALFATVREGDRVERRIERINRSAYLLARTIGGNRASSPFAVALAEESARRSMPRRSLDALLAAARRTIRDPDAATPAVWETRTRDLAAAGAEALLGVAPTPATVDAAAGILRIVRLLAVPAEIRVRRFHLPLEGTSEFGAEEPMTAMAEAVADECEAIHQLLLRGARGVGEVPLTFRAALAASLALSLRLLGHAEQHPDRLLHRAVRLGRLETAWTLFQLRRRPLA